MIILIFLYPFLIMEKKTFSKEEIEVLNQELFNQIFLEKNYIYEFYSTNELKRYKRRKFKENTR